MGGVQATYTCIDITKTKTFFTDFRISSIRWPGLCEKTPITAAGETDFYGTHLAIRHEFPHVDLSPDDSMYLQ